MKMAKLISVAAIVIAAGILVWNLMWMQEVGNKYDINQLREEARQLEGESSGLTRDVIPETKSAVPVKEEEMVRSMPQPAEEETMEEPLQEKMEEVRTDVVSRPEPVAEKIPEQIVQGEQVRDFDEPAEEVEILNKDVNQLKPVPNQPRVITIKGNPVSNPAPHNRNVTEKTNNKRTPVTNTTPVTIIAPVTQHPTSTSP